MRFTAFLIALAFSRAVLGQGTDGPSTVAARTVWDGVYSDTQATRGQASYDTHCANCHRDDLGGYEGLLRGRRFMEKYREASLHLLFDKTKSTMPRDAAGSLSDQTYVDILSYVLKANEFPAGDAELAPDDLLRIRLVARGGAQPVPNFSLVRVVGCLARRDDALMVTRTTELVRTGQPRPGADELAAARAASVSPPLGTESFGLMVSAANSPADQIDRVVEVRGFLMRGTNNNRINVTSIETVGPVCGP